MCGLITLQKLYYTVKPVIPDPRKWRHPVAWLGWELLGLAYLGMSSIPTADCSLTIMPLPLISLEPVL